MSDLLLPKPVPEPRPRRSPIARRVALKRGPAPKRRARPRAIRQTETAALRRECRALCSRITLARCGYRCECGCGRRATDAAHGLSKGRHRSVEFDLDNLVGLARFPCHRRLGSARTNGGGEMSALMLQRKGVAAWTGVLRRSLLPEPDVRDRVVELRGIAAMEGCRC